MHNHVNNFLTICKTCILLNLVSTLITPLLASHFYLLILLRILLGVGEGLGLPTMYHIFAHAVQVQERSRAFSYLAAAGTIGQTVAALIGPHVC